MYSSRGALAQVFDQSCVNGMVFVRSTMEDRGLNGTIPRPTCPEPPSKAKRPVDMLELRYLKANVHPDCNINGQALEMRKERHIVPSCPIVQLNLLALWPSGFVGPRRVAWTAEVRTANTSAFRPSIALLFESQCRCFRMLQLEGNTVPISCVSFEHWLIATYIFKYH
jgi:hypothetical protein